MSTFELTRPFISNLQELIREKKAEEILVLLSELHPADIADISVELQEDESHYLYQILDDDVAADVITELESEDRKRVLDRIPSEAIARRLIDNMDSDDAADIIAEFDDKRQQEVLSHIEDVDVAGDIVDLLNYDEDSAGGLMAKELIKVKENWGITMCLRSMRRQAENVDEIYYVYVVDNDNILVGTLSLKKMLLNSSSDTLVKDIYNPDVISVNVNSSSEEVSNIMDKYGLVVLPVVDSIGRLVGRITIDDVVDIIREEAGKDYQLASGITEDVAYSDSVWVQTRARVPWLLIGLLGGIVGSRVIGGFENYLGRFPHLAFFMPLIGAMGGNVGIQSSALVVQSLASGVRDLGTNLSKWIKEISVALFNASILAIIIFSYNQIIGSEIALTYTVTLALFSVVLFASLFGTIIPLVLNYMKIDPAVATGPFITTLNDIIGMFLYLTIGSFFYSVF